MVACGACATSTGSMQPSAPRPAASAAPRPTARPPAAHPAENTLWVRNLDGSSRWSHSPEQRIQGVWPAPDRRSFVVGAGLRATDDRRDLFGALVYRLDGEGGGAEHLEVACPTEGPVFFRPVLADDGRIALAEHPFLDPQGALIGAYRVTVLR